MTQRPFYERTNHAGGNCILQQSKALHRDKSRLVITFAVTQPPPPVSPCPETDIGHIESGVCGTSTLDPPLEQTTSRRQILRWNRRAV